MQSDSSTGSSNASGASSGSSITSGSSTSTSSGSSTGAQSKGKGSSKGSSGTSSNSGSSSTSGSASSAASSGSNNAASGSAASGSNNASSGSAATANNSTGTATTGNTKGSGASTAVGALSSDDITAPATENNSDPQSSLTLDPRVIATGFMNNGQDVQEAGQVSSLTSNNNFINYCLTQGSLPITNGQQITTGSCNPAPIGTIPSVSNMPSAKFAFPTNMGTVSANTEFTIKLNMNNLETGHFVNANENYFAAPQQLSPQGQIIGHTHVVIEAINGLADTTASNPQQFAFFKGINTAAVNGQVTADVTAGVPAGTYRICTINSSSNHQPVIVPIAQHGSLDDCVYFTATDGGSATASGSTADAGATDSASAAAASATTSGKKGNKGKNN
ncbi:hypothetical protein D9757_003249 [Collybiopsis confluens]|uniref:Uncharacterized protein n=1 Tax=Collybiopsis confluens TaxID=2823264 RepID=A0A8H5HZH3_9AGAR|nr:hypothetical protein D9757_003249 [Collybiopsis confluens]